MPLSSTHRYFNMYHAVLVLVALFSISAAQSTSTTNGAWDIAPVSSGQLARRHEACAVMVRGLLVLIGGRGSPPVSVYDPRTRVWTNRQGAPGNAQIHHFQCVSTPDGRIWIPSSWRGGFPNEQNNERLWIYDVVNDQWSSRDGLPEPRRRGGAAAVRRGGRIYVIGGNRGGHGSQATTLGWMDVYIIRQDRWITNLPDLPVGRDHVGGAIVRGQICIAGGRDGGRDDFFFANIASTYCYRFRTQTWRRRPDMPQARAGAMTGRTCDRRMMVAGGEGNGQAYARVDIFNGRTWSRAPDLVDSRHGSGLGISSCRTCGQIFIPSGSGNQGGNDELFTTERWIPAGNPQNCAQY